MMAFNLPIDQLEETEEEIEARFPDHCRTSMLDKNGGTIELNEDQWEIIPIRDTTDRKRISRTCNNVISETELFSEWGNWHDNAYAIAHNGAGDVLVLLRTGSKFEHGIYVWTHEDGTLQLIQNYLSTLRDA